MSNAALAAKLTVYLKIRIRGGPRSRSLRSLINDKHPRRACQVCGSTTDLFPDPAGYYWHSEREDGAPLCHGDARMTEAQKAAHRRVGETVR